MSVQEKTLDKQKKRFNISITGEVMKGLRRICVEEETNVSNKIEELIVNLLNKESNDVLH